MQETAIELLSTPAWDRHLRTLATALRDRCAALVSATAEIPQWTLARVPAGGLHLWFQAPPDAFETARARGVTVNPGRGYFAAEPPGSFIRLSFAATPDITELLEGARRLL